MACREETKRTCWAIRAKHCVASDHDHVACCTRKMFKCSHARRASSLSCDKRLPPAVFVYVLASRLASTIALRAYAPASPPQTHLHTLHHLHHFTCTCTSYRHPRPLCFSAIILFSSCSGAHCASVDRNISVSLLASGHIACRLHSHSSRPINVFSAPHTRQRQHRS
jgi:hypothetical protein